MTDVTLKPTVSYIKMSDVSSSTPARHACSIAKFALDTSATALLVLGVYPRRYRAKELVTAAALFNGLVGFLDSPNDMSCNPHRARQK